MPQDETQCAQERFALLRPYLEADTPLAIVARDAGISYRTAQRWVASYLQLGLEGLTRQERTDRGIRRVLSPPLQETTAELARRIPALSAAEIHRQVYRQAQQQNEPPPSYATVYALVREIRAASGLLEQYASGNGEPLTRHQERLIAERPNSLWRSTHFQLDVLIAHGDAPPTRPWLTLVLDDFSRGVAGYVLHAEVPSALQTALALYHAIRLGTDVRWPIYGIPDVLCADDEGDLARRQLEKAATCLGIRIVFTPPHDRNHSARFGSFRGAIYTCCLSNLPKHITPAGKTSDQPILTLLELDKTIQNFIADIYHLNRHPEIRMAPRERWSQNGFTPRAADFSAQLATLLPAAPKPRLVHPEGVYFKGMQYGHPLLAARVGEQVTLRFDSQDITKVCVFHDGEFLCWAYCRQHVEIMDGLGVLIKVPGPWERGLATT